MSQPLNHPSARYSMPPTDEEKQDTSHNTRSSLNRSDGGSVRHTAVPLGDARASGELEGSTLGSSSRNDDRRTPNQRRIQSSSGFLIDSLPRSKSSRIGPHSSRPSETSVEKRTAPEADIVVPKKRSRFPWTRHKHSASESVSATATTTPSAAQQAPTPPPEEQPPRISSTAERGTYDADQSTAGLDRDSIQIVNLALNLNESRRRTASGLLPGSAARRPLSVSLPAGPPLDPRTQYPRANNGNRYFSHRPDAQILGDEVSRGAQYGGQSPVVDLLPPTVVDVNRAYEFSSSTITRADRARRHFELFHEYLRVLPLLPPLRTRAVDADSDSSPGPVVDSSTNRRYNPLQVIRNRRIRYREKSPIDAEAEGWHDPEKVHDWVNLIEEKYSKQTHGPNHSIKLPSFQRVQRSDYQDNADDMDGMAVSPPSSLRRVSRTNSTKALRPRLDWKICPAELLADAAWSEDVGNKAKLVDKDGNKLYTDPTELVLMDASADSTSLQNQQISVEVQDSAREELSSRHTSLSSSHHPALAHEFKSVGRGRHRHRFRGHSHSLRSRSASSSQKRSHWDKVRMRTRSVSSDSSDSSAGRRSSMDRKSRVLGHPRKKSERVQEKDAAHSLDPYIRRTRSPAAAVLNMDRNQSQLSEPPSIDTKAGSAQRRTSFSSNASLEDRYHPRMSLEALDSTAPNSPAQAGFFPSIAVNLSPPSSRSPSPAKKGLRHKIASRHERSKSKQGDREREHQDEARDVESPSHRASTAPLEQTERTSKLEPSPLPDVVSSSYTYDQNVLEGNRNEGYRGRKGQSLPDSKLRGILKGPGRIAEIVGNEVSKVGDMILKKDAVLDSRKSSSATTIASEDSDSDEEERRTEKRSGPKALLRRLPNLGDEPGRLTRRDSDKATSSRSFIPSLSSFTSPLRQDERRGSTDAVDYGSPTERAASRKAEEHEGPRKMALSRSKTFDFGPALQSTRARSKPHTIKDASNPFSLTRPPVTGLAQARASPGPFVAKRAPLSGATRAWSISDRSLHTSNDNGVPGKAEIERTRALLLSSGIKAREITRRAHSVRDSPPHWLQNSLGPGSSVSRGTRINEFDLAAQNLLRRFEMTQYSFQQSMHHFNTATSSPLRSQLKELEILINQTLTPRVRATADDAEDLCVQLNTTSTLAVKSLSDALDKGVRKRRRRLRWVRRTGFFMLEWALVGMLWWVWLIVMAFKLVRGIFRGLLSGARWILWL
ncbi:uncharacterized protein N7459_005896 [Penicillium hispanicum]|uniref:uncharacterized protein n=1 Tax=Penicillium hispanicum TaxID=1080232 RepID=UPI002540ED1C|nr:uncharacterized protein N7459_005896 [Penicillium hispanicum]KAJ5579911.1 hypothetical protein N7459_005896 [Penicillium hispanicum]